MLNKLKLFIATIACSLAFTASVNALPVLQINDTGILTGATGVLVNNELFDVQFRDGVCGGLQQLCDSSGLTFKTSESAQAASQALLDQVFLGIYDDNYQLTNGCQFIGSTRTGCAVLTAYDIYQYSSFPYPQLAVLAEAAFNTDINQVESWLLLALDSTSTIWDYATYAVWTPVSVPEPAPLALLLAGLGIVFLKRRKHLQHTRH